jgi:hypothetical protein
MVERLLSIVMPVRRYRCATMSCQWVGNLRQKYNSPPGDDRIYRSAGRDPYL